MTFSGISKLSSHCASEVLSYPPVDNREPDCDSGQAGEVTLGDVFVEYHNAEQHSADRHEKCD